jgi:hypothetical protein
VVRGDSPIPTAAQGTEICQPKPAPRWSNDWAEETFGFWANAFPRSLAQLDPTVRDLSTWRARVVLPTAELPAAVRRNSALEEWLAFLPSLSPLPP